MGGMIGGCYRLKVLFALIKLCPTLLLSNIKLVRRFIMMSKFKKAAIVLVIIMLFLLQAGISLAQPQDLEGHWAKEVILDWLDYGLIECCEDGLFYPDEQITRGEFMALTNIAFGFFESTEVTFSDLAEDHQYADEVARAVAAGYISGFDDNTVRPDERISRLEVAAVLAKIAELPQSEDLTILERFTDSEDIPIWGRGFVGAIVDMGLLSGYPDGSFKPQKNITRAEAIFVLNNAVDALIVPTENITNPGYFNMNFTVFNSGTIQNLILYYFLGDDFTEGSAVFHLPPEITATANQDVVAISSNGGKVETFELEPIHIADGGKEVHITGITASVDDVVLLLLKDKKIPDPGYYDFSVTADADGSAEKLPTEDEPYETVELFSRIIPGSEGILDVSPGSAESGINQTFTLSYTLADDFNEGWIEFNLPQEITATAGKDKIVLAGEEKLLAETDISDDGEKVKITDITAQKGDVVTLILYDKTIPEPGPYLFSARSDADGEKAQKKATLGAGSEFMAFFAYSEVYKDNDIVKSFIKALSEGDSEAAIGLLADNVVYVNNYMDGFLDVFVSREDVIEEIEYMLDIDYGYKLVNDESTLKALIDNVWEVKGKTDDYFTRLLAELNPGEGYDGLGYTGKFFVMDNKISYIEFLWDLEDELLYDRLVAGSIGLVIIENDNGDIIVKLCAPGLPAAKAGLKPGDIIVAVNGINVEDMEFGISEAAFRVVGKAETKVELTINRNGEVFNVELVREAALNF